MNILLFYAFFFAPVSASPANLVGTPGGSACLAVLLTLFLLLSFLVICKRVYLKRRRLNHAAAVPGRFSFKTDSYAQSSTSALPSVTQAGATSLGGGKAGFLVGFFGSPAWETRIKNLVDKSTWMEYRQSSFMYHLHADSRRAKSSKTLNSSLTEQRSLDNGTSRSLSISTIGDIRVLYEMRDATGLVRQRKARSLRLPTRPSKAYAGTPITLAPRRFSLPSMSRKDAHSILHRKSASSVKSSKSSKTRRSDVSSSSFQGNSSLRLVEPSHGLDYPLPLPLSPAQSDKASFTGTTKISHTPNSQRYSDLSAPPIPPLPAFPLDSMVPTHKQLNHASQSSPALLRISHPYALPSTSNNTSSISSTLAPLAPDNHLATRTSTNKADITSGPRKPLAPVISSINRSPFVVSYPPATYSPDYNNFPPPPTFVSPKIKQKTRTSLRIRRSPAIGPSPLRTMILPDTSDPSSIRIDATRDRDSRTPFPSMHSRLGLGFSSSSKPRMQENLKALGGGVHDFSATEPEARRDCARKRQNSAADDNDPDILLGIIRELVEETREWDGSLFMDKNFKSMMQNSQLSSSDGANACKSLASNDYQRHEGEGITEDESAEFDLSLLGLDIFRSDGETFIPADDSKRHLSIIESADLVSFWEDGGWVNDEGKRNIVGVAC